MQTMQALGAGAPARLASQGFFLGCQRSATGLSGLLRNSKGRVVGSSSENKFGSGFLFWVDLGF